MKLAEPNSGFSDEKSIVELSHGDRSIKWNISMLSRTKNDDNLDRFAEINGYWANLSEQRQTEIFNVYASIKDIMHSSSDQNLVFQQLQPLVAKLFVLNPLEEISTWLRIYSDLRTPMNVFDTYEEAGDSRNSRQRTYTTAQYRDLVTMCVCLRIMVPVWGDYINITDRISGTTFKEFSAAKLLTYSTIAESEPMDRLREYIGAAIPAEIPKEVIMNGISSEDFPDWIIARVLIRRLVVADLRGTDVKKSLMPFIHTFIDGMVNPKRNNFAGMIKEKTTETSSTNEDSNLSILEGYRPRQELSAGNIATMAVYTRDQQRMALRICKDLPLQLLTQSLKSTKALLTEQIMPVQLSLASWVLKTALPARALPYLRKTDVISCIAVAQAILWYRGHYELAGLVSAVAKSNEHVQQMRSIGSRGRIPPDMLEEIHALYPYSVRPTGKARDANIKDPKELNMSILTIKEIDKLFSKNDWTLTLPVDWVERLTKNKNNRNYSTPHEMRVRLASLIIAVAKRSL